MFIKGKKYYNAFYRVLKFLALFSVHNREISKSCEYRAYDGRVEIKFIGGLQIPRVAGGKIMLGRLGVARQL